MTGEPGAHLGVLVGGIVIEDGVDQLAGGHGGLDPVEETDEFLVAMARHALADHCAVEDIQRSEHNARLLSIRWAGGLINGLSLPEAL